MCVRLNATEVTGQQSLSYRMRIVYLPWPHVGSIEALETPLSTVPFEIEIEKEMT